MTVAKTCFLSVYVFELAKQNIQIPNELYSQIINIRLKHLLQIFQHHSATKCSIKK